MIKDCRRTRVEAGRLIRNLLQYQHEKMIMAWISVVIMERIKSGERLDTFSR